MAAEIIFNIILGLLIVLYLFFAVQLPTLNDTADVLGANGFPQYIGVLALLVLAIISFTVIRKKQAVEIPLFNPTLPEGRLLLANIFLLAGYIGLLNILGFAVSTLLYLFIAPTTFGYSKWRLLTVFSVVGAILLVSLFGTVFYIPLPRGIGLFRELSYLVY